MVEGCYDKVFPGGAEKARESLLRILDLIEDNPMIGRKSVGFVEVREFAVAKTPFSIVYTFVGEHFEVLRVWDQLSGGSR